MKSASVNRQLLCISTLIVLSIGGCYGPSGRLSFPKKPLERTDTVWRYDTNANGIADFALRTDEQGVFDLITYDDDEDGEDDRNYRLSEYDNNKVPHVIVMLDSIPYRTLKARYDKGDLPWFNQPVKVIPPFPSMSEVIFSTLLHTAPQPGMINRHYDKRNKKINNMIWKRALGEAVPMDARLNYQLKYWENGLMFLYPRPWFQVDLYRVKQVIDKNPNLITIVYLASTAGLLSKYGQKGANESIDGIIQLCMQLLHEREGAIKISILADHGHNYIPGKRFDIAAVLTEAGFTVSKTLDHSRDVVIDMDGMINYSGLHTKKPDEVTSLLAQRAEVQLVAYMKKDAVLVSNRHGVAAIDSRGGKYRYRVITHDVLGYENVIAQLKALGKCDAQGFVDAQVWLASTADHQFPDAPYRLWRAFHGLAINAPSVMVAMADGYYAGLAHFEAYIKMASTHGGLDQKNSATFVMSMTGRLQKPLRSEAVLPTLEPHIFETWTK